MYTKITVLHGWCSHADLLYMSKNTFLKGHILKIILKIYGENSPRGGLPIVIYLWY